MKLKIKLASFTFPLLLAACISSSCPEGEVTYLSPPYPPAPELEDIEPQAIIINRQEILVDRVITGPVCNDTWSGTVYLTCDIQVPAWEEDPFFWQDCNLNIEDGTVVIVEAHKNKEYTDGCSCHE